MIFTAAPLQHLTGYGSAAVEGSAEVNVEELAPLLIGQPDFQVTGDLFLGELLNRYYGHGAVAYTSVVDQDIDFPQGSGGFGYRPLNLSRIGYI